MNCSEQYRKRTPAALIMEFAAVVGPSNLSNKKEMKRLLLLLLLHFTHCLGLFVKLNNRTALESEVQNIFMATKYTRFYFLKSNINRIKNIVNGFI
jgi:hypothetical protein